MVGRRQIGLVIDRIRVHAVTARWLQRNEGIAQLNASQRQMIIMHIGYARRRPPLRRHFLLHLQRQIVKPRRVLRRRHASDRVRQLLGAKPGIVVGAAVNQRMNQRGAVFGQLVDAITGVAHRAQDAHQRCRRVEANCIADLRCLAVGIGKNKGHALVRIGQPFQPRETRRKTCHARHAIGQWFVFDRLVGHAGGPRLERHRDGDDAPVELRQHHVHRGVERVHAARRLLPLPQHHAAGHGLQHRHIESLQHTD